MSYESLEESVSDSRPIECYKFIGSQGRVYLYTSANTSVSLGGQRYSPIAITRSRIKTATNEDSDVTLELEIPFDTEVCLDYAYAQVPPKLELEVYRKQGRGTESDYVLYWNGVVRGFDVRGRIASISVPSMASLALSTSVPNVYFQAPCNHILYNSRCGVSAAANKVDRVVGGASSQTILLDASAGANGDFRAGEIVNNRSLERRLVLDNVGVSITIGFPFFDIRPGDPVSIYKGCDHTVSTCHTKFNNVINFGGFPNVPADNPFEGSL